jgi:hypothetical protein
MRWASSAASMSRNLTDSESIDETLESAHQALRRLEVDTYRLRTDLTRLQAAVEDGAVTPSVKSVSREEVGLLERDAVPEAKSAEPDWSPPPLDVVTPDFPPSSSADAAGADGAPADDAGDLVETVASKPPRQRWALRRTSRPMMASLSVHGVLLLLIVSIGVAEVVRVEKPYGTLVDLGKPSPPPAEEVKALDLGPIAQLDETNLSDATPASEAVDLGGSPLADVTPVDFETMAGVASLGDAGAVTALKPIDTGEGVFQPAGNGGTGADGMEPAGGGGDGKGRGTGGGRKGGPVGAAMFFGTKAKGDRFVFVVDNSSSMKNGRLEMALAELVKTVESLTPKQSFYVVFVSDQTYPMFYPQIEQALIPATSLNKKRLVEWLPKAILASGKNRELITAMNIAAQLQPQAVYLLWDGDMRYSDNVRLDVMTHLTAPNQWNFTVHTIGMGVTSLDAEQNLTAIAQAHGGVYRRIDVPTVRGR